MAKMEMWSRDLNVAQNIFCAWPLVLVAFGGALGGGLGALAWAINVKIMKSDYIALVTYPAVILMGLSAFAVYFGIVAYLVIQYPDVFVR